MRQKLKQFGCYLIIIVLLPYVVTVFINGPSMVSSSHVDQMYIKVKAEGEDGEDKTIELPIEDYCIGIMAREIPPDYEKEALKAQAGLGGGKNFPKNLGGGGFSGVKGTGGSGEDRYFPKD